MRGTYNSATGTCMCDVGFGGEDCSINLLELSTIGSPVARKLQEVERLAELHVREAVLVSAADAPASVPFSLRNMLLYADTLVASRTEAAAVGGHGRRLLDASDPLDGVEVGCGFYDLFYEGCGITSNMNCFYDLPCAPDASFYDFYTGETLRHAPDTEYFDDFLVGSVFGDRGTDGKSDVIWSHDTSVVTSDGEEYLGGLGASTALRMQMGDLPNAPHELIMSFDFLAAGGMPTYDKSPVTLTVLGEGAVEASAVLDVSTPNQPIFQVEFKFTYASSNLRLKIMAAPGVLPEGATWGIDKVMVSSMVTNYPPLADDKMVFISPDPVAGGANTIELHGFDQECEGMEFLVTALPTEGKLFQCSCDSIWTLPMKPSDLPVAVNGPCHRLVYEPAANEPKEDMGGNPFDAFQYRIRDGYGAYSEPAFVKIFIDTPDTEDTPVSGPAGLAIACDGKDDLVSVSWALGEPGEDFSIELRFKVTGDAVGTLVYKAGSYWLGWTEFGGLGVEVATSEGPVRAETLNGFADRMWHHLAASYDSDGALKLFVDGEEVASQEADGGMPLYDPSAHAMLCAQVSEENPQTVKTSTAYNGHLDEIRFWGISLDEEKVMELNAVGYIAEPDNEEGLLAYFDFNLGANVPVSSAVFDRTAAHVDAFFSVLSNDGRSAGLDEMFPAYVASTAVYTNLVTTNEDTAVTVPLHGGDLEGGVTFWVATLPVKGDLVDAVTGKTVLTSPAPVRGSTIVYHPKGSANGKDVFKYQAFDGTSFSYKHGVLLDIKPINDPPVCAPLTTTVTTVAGPKLVQLIGTDEDADAFLRYIITRPPRRGQLFQSDINGKKLALIDESMTSVGSTSAFVLYEPRDVGNDDTEGYPYDSFAYSVYDRYSNSSECVVDISVPDDGCDPKPVAGDPGYCLRFDGQDDILSLGALSMLLPAWPYDPEMSLAFYFRTSYLTTAGLQTLARAGPFSIQMSKVYGLALALGPRVGPTFEPFNEGGWHRVVLTFDGSSAHLYVDGVLRTSLVDVELPEAYDDSLVLGYHTLNTWDKTGHFNGQVDEVSLWSSVVDAVRENAAVMPNFAGYAATSSTYDTNVVGHWSLNEAQGIVVRNGVDGKEVQALGEGGLAYTQPRWVASTLAIGNVWNATEGSLELMHLECSSEYTDTLDAVLLTLPGAVFGGGKLWYTEDGMTPLYRITHVPTVLKAGKVIYEPGILGTTADFMLNYGNFAYVCIGDLQRTLQDHLKGFDFYGVSGPTRQSALGDFLSSISDLIRNLPVPPSSAPPVVSDGARAIHARAPSIDKKALENILSFYGLLLHPIPPTEEEDEIVLPPLPPKPDVPPSIEDLAQIVLRDLIDSFFPALGGGLDGAAGSSKISAINIRTKFAGLNATQMVKGVTRVSPGENLLLLGDPTPYFEEFLEAFVKQLATQAGVSEEQVQILGVYGGIVIVEAKVSYSASNQVSAKALEVTASTNGDALWVGDFTLKYGTATVTDVSTDAVFVQVAPGVAPSCFQISQIVVTTVNVQHTNHMPEACAGGCNIAIGTAGSGKDVVFEIDATDIDGDELEVRVTYLALKGTLLAPFGTASPRRQNLLGFSGNYIADQPVQGDLFDFYISREGSRVIMDPSTGKFPVVYSPQVNAYGMPHDSFGFVVWDGTTLSREYTVTVDVEDLGLLSQKATAGNSGYALEFDGVDDRATFGPVSAYNLEAAATFAMWIKTGSAATGNGMTVLSAGKYRIHWSKLGGLAFSVNQAGFTTEVASNKPLNDLFWHHVIAAYDGEHAMLFVDGVSMGAEAVMQPHGHQLMEVNASDAMLIIGARYMDGGHPIEYFGGIVDEFVVFNKASAMLMASTAMMRRCGASHLACFEGDEDGLAGYWRFNEAMGSHLTNEVEAPEGITEDMQRLGESDGIAASMPSRVASTVPLLNTVELLEDTEASFELAGVSVDLEDPIVHVTVMPAKGRMYVDNTTRVFVGSTFPLSKVVTYKPKDNFHGTETFGYYINDGTMDSDIQIVKLVVHPQNDIPEAADFAVAVDFKDPSPVEIKLKARDVDEDITKWLVTFLPMHGILYQSVNSSFETPSRTLAGQITAPNSVVTSPVYYMPMVNDAGMQDLFGYVVEDEAAVQVELSLTSAVTSFNSGNTQTTQLRPFSAAESRRLRSRMGIVTLDGSAMGLAVQDTPVVGMAGLALQFDGLHSVASLGDASSYGLMTPSRDKAVTISAWFKTSSVTVENRMALVVAGPYSLTWTKVLGLQFSVGSSRVATYSAWNDGVWHHVMATYDAEIMTLAVDGASNSFSAPATWDDSVTNATVWLGAEGEMSTSSYYNGFIDDLVVGSSAAGFFRFNEASGDVLINEGYAGNGTMGVGGVASTQPTRVASSAPIRIGDITLEEDQEVTVQLLAHNTDAAATGVTFVITALPAMGSLYTADAVTGAKKTLIKPSQLPKSLALGVDKVVFVPEANTFSGPATRYAEFSYAADIAGSAVSAARSASMTRAFYVLPVNDTPRISKRFLSAAIEESKVATISLAEANATDIETDDLVMMVTFLPAIGLLFQHDDTLITNRNTIVTDSELRVKYVPPPNLAGAPLAAFGFVVSDGELMSEAGTVTITVTGNSAVDLSAGGNVFVGGSSAPPQLDGAFTVDAWVRIPNQGLAASVWAVVSTAFASLTNTPETIRAQHWPATLALVNPMPEFEVGRWHHMAFVSKLEVPNGGAMLFVDGQLVALQSVSHEQIDTLDGEATLVIGAPAKEGANPAAFLGKVDEVRVWNRGLLQYEVITSMNLRTDTALNSETGNEAVGKGIELYLAPDLHDSLVAYWSFDDVTESGEVPEAVAGANAALTGDAFITKLHAPMAPASAEAQALVPLIATKGTGYALHMDGEDDSATAELMGDVASENGAALHLWFKTGNTLGFMALASIGAMSVHWTAAGGLGVHMNTGGSLHTFRDWSDGSWHHVKAVAQFVPSAQNYPEVGPGSWNLTLTVDDEMYGPVMATADGSLFRNGSILHLGASSNDRWSAMGLPFSGTIDFAAATTADGMHPLALLQFDGPMSLEGKMRDMSGNGAHAVLNGSPAWVFSTAPRTVPTYTVLEDSGMTAIQLLAADADSDILKYYITHIPENGKLFVSTEDGFEEIEHACPAGGDEHDDEAVCDPIPYAAGEPPVVYFQPEQDMYGTALIQYVADDGMVMSDPTYIVVDVLPVNDLPTLEMLEMPVHMEELSNKVITLGEAQDVDPGTKLIYVISTLPVKGKLYQYPMVAACTQFSGMKYPAGHGCHDIAGGGEILEPGTIVSDLERRVVYVPLVNGEGSDYDLFGYQVTDGNVGTCQGEPPLPCPEGPGSTALAYYSAEGLVKISAGQVMENSLPIAGHAGYALEFDGVDDMVVVNTSVSTPFTLEVWMKTSAAVNEFTSIATLVASGADPDYVNVHLTRFGAIGMDVAIGGIVRAVYTFATVNDGTWHHIAAFFDGSTLGVIVDGESCSSCFANHPGGMVPTLSFLTLGPASASAYSYLFAGQLDDIRLWGYTRSLEQVMSDMHTLLHGDEDGLLMWFPLDGQSTQNGIVRDDAAAGSVDDGVAMGDIQWVASSAPVHTLKYDMDEDARLGVDLYATDADFDPLQFYVMSIPSKGVLYPTAESSEAIEHVPYLLPGSRVWYEAPLHTFGGPAFDAFRYGAHDGSAFSNEAIVVVDTVSPTSDRSTLLDLPKGPYEVATGGSIIIEVSATDADLIDAGSGDMVNLKITSLPNTGSLHQVAADGMSAGEAITAPNTALTATSVEGLVMRGKVVFVPDMDFSSGYDASTERAGPYTVSFGVAVQDMNSAYMYGSDEKIVEITVVQKRIKESPLDLTAPLGLGAAGFGLGLSGQAVLLDGEELYIAGGNSTTNSSLFGPGGSFTIDMYFKTTAAVQERTVLVAKDGVLSIGWRRYFGLSAAITTLQGDVVLAGSKQRHNDGAWHHLAVVWNAQDSSLSMYVDNTLVDLAQDADRGAIRSESGELVIGGDGLDTKTHFYSGFLDEFKVWGAALDAQGVADSFRGVPNGDEEAPLSLRYSFDQANFPTGALVVDSSGAGRHAAFVGGEPVFLTSSTPVYMKTVVVTQDTAKTIRLAGSDVDFDALDFRITQFPDHGELYVDGANIDYVPYRLPANELVFVPGPHAAEDTTFTFVVSDGKVFSAVATVHITMIGLPDGPTALPVPAISTFTDVCGFYVGNNRAEAPELGMKPQPWWQEACNAGDVALYEVALTGYDADGDNITFHITTLPQIGRLYQARPDNPSQPDLLEPVTAPGTVVVAQDGVMATVWYSLQDVDYLSAPQEIFFGYAVSETAGTHLTSIEQHVAVVLAQRPEAFSIFSGIKGFAIYFDGSDSAVEAPVGTSINDFTVEAWFKSSGALLDGATLLSTSAFRVGWTSYGGLGMQFFGFAANLHSNMHLNDGEWHHVAVSVDRSGPTTLYIDGAVAAARPITPGIDLEDMEALTIGRSAMPQGSGVRTQFRGQVDEVRLWTTALSAAEIAGRMNLLVDGAAEGLATYLRFNRGDITTSLTVRDLSGSGNRTAIVDGVPHLVTSSAPIMMLVQCEENAMVMISLTGGDEAAGAVLQAIITELPGNGTLYHASTMEAIAAVPTIVQDPLNQVIFEPDEHTYGDELAVPTYLHSVVRFITAYTDAETGETSRSDEDTIVVVVTPVNYPPTLEEAYVTMEVSSYDDVLIRLKADDLDEDELTFVITTLPTHGVLYHTADGITRGMRITSPGSALAAGAEHVLYSPILVDNDSWGQFTTYFGYTAFDLAGPGGRAQYAIQPEALVVFNVTMSISDQPPVAGDPAWALLFNGFGKPAELPAPADLSNQTAITIEMWIKTSAAMARVDNAVVFECDAFRLELGRIIGLSFTVSTADGDVATVNQEEPSLDSVYTDVNDGAWHFVSATFRTNVGGVAGNTSLALYIDGEVVGKSINRVNKGLRLAALAEQKLFVGKYFSGLVDEVRLWNRELTVSAWQPHCKYNWDAMGKEALSGNEKGLIGYWRFNEPSIMGFYNYATRFASVNASLGSSIKVPSAAPFGDVFHVGEDQSIVYCLQGNGGSLLVTMVPQHGKLFQAPGGSGPGEEIPYAPTLVADEGGCVMYVPDQDYYGPDSLAYITRNPEGVRSNEVTVAAVVSPVNDPPQVIYFDKEIITHRNIPVSMTIVGADVDHPDTASITITALPYGGYLVHEGKRIATQFAELGAVAELTYVPVPNMYGEGESALYDEFTFAVMDPAGGVSATITVPIHVLRQQALLANFREPLALGDLETMPETFTLGLWIKSSPLPARRRTLSAYQLRPANRGASYVDFSTSGTDVNSMMQTGTVLEAMQIKAFDVQDGRWHHVAAIYDGELKNVYIDGRLDTSQAVSVIQAEIGINATVGASTYVREFLTRYLTAADRIATLGGASDVILAGIRDSVLVGALIDDVRIYPRALTVQELRLSMRQHSSEAELDESLALYNGFNMEEGPEYVNLNAAVAGEAGYAIRAAPGHVVVITDNVQSGGAPFTMTPSTEMTVSIWFRTSRSCSSMGALVSKGALLGTWGAYRDSNVGGQWTLQYTAAGGLGFHIQNLDGVIISANSNETYCDGVWHMATGIYDGANSILYVDGQLKAIESMKGLSVTQSGLDMNSQVVVGGDGEAAKTSGKLFETSIFYGHLDDLKVWSYRRERPELLDDFSMRIPTNTSDERLRAWYRFNEASGAETLPDSEVVNTQQGLGSPPRIGTISGQSPDSVWVASFLPVQKSFDLLGFNTQRLIPIFYVDADADIAEPVVTHLPERGSLWVSNAAGDLIRQLRREGEAILNYDGDVPVYANYIAYIPGDLIDEIPTPYDSFAYAASDGREVGPDETFTVNVFALNQAPIVQSDIVTVKEDTPTRIVLKVKDPEGQPVTVSILSFPERGTLASEGGEPLNSVTQNDDGEVVVIYTPALNDVSIQSFTFRATDSEGAESAVATVTLVVECVNDAPEVLLAREVQETYRGQRRSLLIGISVADVDSADHPDFSVTVSVPEGVLSAVSSTDVLTSTLKQITFTGTVKEVNIKLGNVFYFNTLGLNSVPVTIQARDNHNECSNGPQVSERVLRLANVPSPFDNVAFSDDGRVIEMVFTCEVDQAPFQGTEDCSILLQEQSLRKLGAFNLCYASGTLQQNPLSRVPCPKCRFGADRRTYTITIAPGATIVPGDPLVTKSSVAKSLDVPELAPPDSCPFGDLLDGDFHPGYVLPVNPPLNPLKPTVELDGPSRVGRCNPIRVNGLQATNALGRMLTYSWSVTGPEPLTAVQAAAVAQEASAILVLPPDLPAGLWEISVTAINWLRASSLEPAVILVEKVDSPIPTVYIHGPDTIRTKRNVDTSIKAEVEASLCPGSCNDVLGLELVWNQVSQPRNAPRVVPDVVSSTGVVLTIPRMTLVPTFTTTSTSFYEFEIRVSDCLNPEISAVAVAFVNVRPNPLTAAIFGGSREWYRARTFTLDGSMSADPDNSDPVTPGEPPRHLVFRWSALRDGVVDTSLGLEQRSAAKIELPNVPEGEVEFRLTVTSNKTGDNRQAFDSAVVKFVTTPQPEVYIIPNLQYKLNPTDYNSFVGGGSSVDGQDITFEWSIQPSAAEPDCIKQPECAIESTAPDLDDMTMVPTGRYNQNLFFYPNTLNPGRYEIQLKVCLAGQAVCSTATTSAVVNTPPTNGIVSVDPAASGVEPCEATEFIVMAHAFVDHDTPLAYEFGFFDDMGMFFSLTGDYRTTAAIILLPSLAKEVGVKVLDGLEAYALEAAPGSAIPISECNSPSDPVAATESLVNRLSGPLLDLAVGLQDPDLALQIAVVTLGVLAGNPPSDPDAPCGSSDECLFRQSIRHNLTATLRELDEKRSATGVPLNDYKQLQFLVTVTAEIDEVDADLLNEVGDALRNVIARERSAFKPLEFDTAGIAVHLISNFIEKMASDGAITQAETDVIFDLSLDVGRAALSYSIIPTRVPITFPPGRPPVLPAGAAKLRISVSSAAADDSPAMLSVGNFDLSQGPLSAMTAVSRRRMLADLPGEAPRRKAVLVSPNFEGLVPPPVNVYDWIEDPDGEPLTAIVGLRAYLVPDCPAAVVSHDYSTGNRQHCDAWLEGRTLESMQTSTFEEPIVNGLEPIRISLNENDDAEYDIRTQMLACKAVIVSAGDLEWTTDTVTTDSESSGIVCESRTFGDFAAFAIPKPTPPPPPSPPPPAPPTLVPSPPTPVLPPEPKKPFPILAVILPIVIVVALLVVLIGYYIYRRHVNANRLQQVAPSDAVAEAQYGSESQPMLRGGPVAESAEVSKAPSATIEESRPDDVPRRAARPSVVSTPLPPGMANIEDEEARSLLGATDGPRSGAELS